MRGAIRRPCRRHGTACRTQTQQIRMPISICRSQTLQKSPQRPCAFRPATQKRSEGRFCDLAKTIASAEQEAKNSFSVDHDTNMHQNASFKLLLLCFSCFNSLFASHFSKMLFLLERGTHFCKTTSIDFN